MDEIGFAIFGITLGAVIALAAIVVFVGSFYLIKSKGKLKYRWSYYTATL